MPKVEKDDRVLTRKQFQHVAQLRADETAILAKNGKTMGAFYLGGLAVECALKACIAKKTKRYDFPRGRRYVEKGYSHDLSELLKLAGLNDQLEQESTSNPGLATNWGVVRGWNVESRYEASRVKGSDMDAAVNSPDGVLQWIKLHW
jgi:HEPN domain-containing protein